MSEETVLRIEIRAEDATNEGAQTSREAAASGCGGTHATPTQLMRLISGRNLELLRLIKLRKPKSLSELARLSGRPKASLTRTLQRLSRHGIVVMAKSAGREKIPTVACDRLRLELTLTPEQKD